MRAALCPASSAAGAGLVSVSTTHTGPEFLKIDHAETRFVRLQKGVGMAGKLHQAETLGRGYQVLFVTLTYAYADKWAADHIGLYLNAVRNDYKRKTGEALRYVWVGEIQDERMARTGDAVVHYHVVFWVVRSYFMPKADRRGWWPHGMSKTERARLSGGSVVYLMGYIKKQRSKEGLPHGCRIFGVGGLSAPGKCVRRWVHLPRFLQARYDCRQTVRRSKGGGWVDGDGVLWASEWGLSALGRGYTRIVRLRTYPSTGIEPVGPYSRIPAFAGHAG